MGSGGSFCSGYTFIGVDDGHCHKTSIVIVIVGTKRFRLVAHCGETRGLPTWKNFWLLQPVSNHPNKDNLKISTVGSSLAAVHPHISMMQQEDYAGPAPISFGRGGGHPTPPQKPPPPL